MERTFSAPWMTTIALVVVLPLLTMISSLIPVLLHSVHAPHKQFYHAFYNFGLAPQGSKSWRAQHPKLFFYLFRLILADLCLIGLDHTRPTIHVPATDARVPEHSQDTAFNVPGMMTCLQPTTTPMSGNSKANEAK